jgi:hypothetical protein
MGTPEASAVPASVLLSILRREMEDILIYPSDRGEITQVFNHLLLVLAGYTILSAAPTNEYPRAPASRFASILTVSRSHGSSRRLLAAGFSDRCQPAC